MNCFFISDDSYFLAGLRHYFGGPGEKLFYRDRRILLLDADDGKKILRPDFGDIVVINVSDTRARGRLLRRSLMSLCRVIIMQKTGAFMALSDQAEFPWVIQEKTDIAGLLRSLDRAVRAFVVYREVSTRERDLLRYLGCGYSPSALADIMGLPAKYIYTLKAGILKKHGLAGLHATSVLLCRDITMIKRLHKYIHYRSEGRYPAEKRRP